MFSGGDSSDGINSLNQFGTYGFINRVAVSNAMAAGQNIDWAQLAQQWIQMRDNSELAPKTCIEPSTNKDVESRSVSLGFEEKGEADMDMDDEEQSDDKTQRYNSLAPPSDITNDLRQSWYFDGNNSKLVASQSASDNQWSSWQNQEMLTTTLPGKSRPANSTAHIPSLLNISVPNPNEIRIIPDISIHSDNTNVMDAAKKKVLPAWIREGLEKMEREKQKLLEKEQQNKDTNSTGEYAASNKNITTKSSDSLHPATILDDDSSDNEHSIAVKGISEKDSNSKEVGNEEDDTYNYIGDQTYEQKLSELMIVVRRTLTELLLEATNEEISKVADETIKRFKSKASSAQVIRKSALSTLTDKLGLAAYGDSSSENESENDESYLSKKTSDQSESGNDSEEEIRNAIRLKRRAFIKTSEEIEERVTASAAQEEEKLKYFLRKEEEEREHSRSKKKERSTSALNSSNSGHIGYNTFKGYEKDFGEITETKIQNINGKRQKERSSRRERITRFSDNKDKSVTIPNAATFLTNLNSGTNFISGNSTSTLATNSQRQNVPDINGLLPNYASTGITNALSAADAALEKALNGKALNNLEKETKKCERDRSYNQSKKRRISEKKKSRSRSKTSSSSASSSSSSTSSDSTSSSSHSSNHSKYKSRSAKRHKSRKFDERSGKSSRDHRDRHKYSSRSYKNKERETNSRSLRNASSESEDDYRRRHRNYSNHSRSSSQKRSYTSSRYARDHERSRSRSRSSYSSNNRRQ